jgi:hypothetical protein
VGTGTAEERTRDMREIVDAATRSGAVVYTLDSRGLVTGVVDASVAASNVPPDMQRRLDRQEEHLVAATLQRVAQETGGLWLRGTNDPASGLRQMLQDNEVYYLLAYEPANTRRDGRFRKIQVRLPRHRGFVARTRSGYFAADERKRPKAPPAPPAKPRRTLDASLGLDEEAARTALAAPLAPGGVPVAMTADYVDLPPDGPQAVVNAEVDLGAVRWQHVGGRLRASMQVAVGVYDADGRLVKPPLGRRAELDAAPGEQDRATRGGLRYQERVALGPGRYQVRVVALPADGAPAGGAARWLEIPDLRDGRLALSSVFLSPPQRRFRRNDTMTFQVYVYNARRGDVDLQAQIRSGETVIAASRPKAAVIEERNGARLPETNEMKLEGLERGSYRLRVVVADKKTGTATFQDVDFVVE